MTPAPLRHFPITSDTVGTMTTYTARCGYVSTDRKQFVNPQDYEPEKVLACCGQEKDEGRMMNDESASPEISNGAKPPPGEQPSEIMKSILDKDAVESTSLEHAICILYLTEQTKGKPLSEEAAAELAHFQRVEAAAWEVLRLHEPMQSIWMFDDGNPINGTPEYYINDESERDHVIFKLAAAMNKSETA